MQESRYLFLAGDSISEKIFHEKYKLLGITLTANENAISFNYLVDQSDFYSNISMEQNNKLRICLFDNQEA
jgi:hypothetical protein